MEKETEDVYCEYGQNGPFRLADESNRSDARIYP